MIAIFSYSAGSGHMIAVTPDGDGFDAVATSRPATTDDPVAALAALGYQLAYAAHVNVLGQTMSRTKYARVHVVPIDPA